MGRYITPAGTVSATTIEISNADSPYAAGAENRLLADVSGGVLTVTLPASPLVGDQVQIIDVTGSAAVNNITVARNGNDIQNAAEDLTIDLNNSITTLVFSGATYGWIVGSV